MNENMMYNSIDTDRELAIILSKFSDQFITDMIVESLNYKFRPFANRMPNLPYVLKLQFRDIVEHCSIETDEVVEKEMEIYQNIVQLVCQYYGLQVTTDIPDEQLYSFVYLLYQIFVCEFSDRMLAFYSNYISMNSDQLLGMIPDDKKSQTRSTYTKKMYSDHTIVGVYENMDTIMDIIASMDIPLYQLLVFLSDENSAQFLCSYIADTGDVYKNHFASYIRDPITRTDISTTIKIRFMNLTQDKMNLSAIDNNPYINKE